MECNVGIKCVCLLISETSSFCKTIVNAYLLICKTKLEHIESRPGKIILFNQHYNGPNRRHLVITYLQEGARRTYPA